MSGLNVLISGAGIAGPAAAHFLVKAGAKVTLIERASELRTEGQQVDVRGNGLMIVNKIGVESTIRANTVPEQGFRFVDSNDNVKAEFPVGEGKGPTAEVEVMRGQLAKLLYEGTKSEVEYLFGDYIESIHEVSDGIEVSFVGNTPSRKFDILIGADGYSSKTRKIAFAGADAGAVRSLRQIGAYFTIPYEAGDGDWAVWYNAPGGLIVLFRPDAKANATRVFLGQTNSDEPLEPVLRLDARDQKKALRELFQGAGWKLGRILDGMDAGDDFYMQKVVQVKMDTWSSGRTVLVGDSGYCPSPISGMGTTVALTGAYILAGEISRNPSDYKAAFKAYEDRMRPLVEKAQKLVPGAPWIASPQTWWGIWLLNTILAFVTWSGLTNLVLVPPATAIELPEYGF